MKNYIVAAKAGDHYFYVNASTPPADDPFVLGTERDGAKIFQSSTDIAEHGEAMWTHQDALDAIEWLFSLEESILSDVSSIQIKEV